MATFPSPTLPVPDPTQSFWTNSPGANALADHGSRGFLTSDADICIIGSGITGISAAHALSRSSEGNKRPLSVIVLEAREFCERSLSTVSYALTYSWLKVLVQRVGTSSKILRTYCESHHTTSIYRPQWWPPTPQHFFFFRLSCPYAWRL
jgi:hypothetical protein